MPSPRQAARGRSPASPAPRPPAPRQSPRSLGEQRRDDPAAAGLVPPAVGLDAGAVFQPFVHDASFLRAHRVHLDDPVVGQGLLGGAIGASLPALSTAPPRASRV